MIVRLALGAVLCALLATPAPAQAPPPGYPPAPGGPPAGPDLTCLCLKQSVDDHYTDMTAKNGELNAAQGELSHIDSQLAAARGQVDVNNQQSVAQFRQMLAQRDAAFRRSHGDLLAAAQSATESYNRAVADYNNQCAGRPLPPPPPGPMSCTITRSP